MSAIYGAVNLAGGAVTGTEHFEEAYKAKNCRIDRYECVRLDDAFLGCGIQYFTDEAKNEKMPFHDTDKKRVFTCCAVLDNRERLIEELTIDEEEGAVTDGAILYKAYMKWGNDFTKYVRGVFSAVVYDYVEKKVILFSDHFAHRSLFYCIRGDVLYFSTMLMPLVKAMGVRPELNEKWLFESVTVPGPMLMLEPKETAYKDVYKVVSGTYVTAMVHGAKETVYWNPARTTKVDRHVTAKDSARLMRQVFSRSVGACLRGSAPIATQLSSGLDSSAVACIAAGLLREKGKKLYSYTSVPLKAAELKNSRFSVLDESGGVLKICEAYPNIVPTFVDTDGRNYLLEAENIVSDWELPCMSQQNAIWVDEIYRKAMENGSRILLTGATGNCTVSAGHIESTFYHYLSRLRFISAFRTIKAVSRCGGSRKLFLKNQLKSIAQYYGWYLGRGEHSCYEGTIVNSINAERYGLKRRITKRIKNSWPIITEREHIRQAYMPEANAQIGEIDTKHSLLYGVLPRDPMRNVEVVELCMQIPWELYSTEDYDRSVIRRAMEDIVPDAIRKNVIRRGVQSGDNEYRVGLVWDEKKAEVRATLTSDTGRRYLDQERVTEYLERMETEGTSSDVHTTRTIVDAYSFVRYVEMLL